VPTPVPAAPLRSRPRTRSRWSASSSPTASTSCWSARRGRTACGPSGSSSIGWTRTRARIEGRRRTVPRAARTERFTEPAWVGEAEQFQVELPADARGDARLQATVLDTEGLAGGPVERRRFTVPGGPVAEASTQPAIVSRAQWGAQAPRSAATYASGVDMAVVHHTAGSNSYTRDQAAGRVRGYQNYHRNTLGWKDIGYNALVDRYGRIYEGREGGLSRGGDRRARRQLQHRLLRGLGDGQLRQRRRPPGRPTTRWSGSSPGRRPSTGSTRWAPPAGPTTATGCGPSPGTATWARPPARA
jgi:hypothetical protein